MMKQFRTSILAAIIATPFSQPAFAQCPPGQFLDWTNVCYDPCKITAELLSLMQQTTPVGDPIPKCNAEGEATNQESVHSTKSKSKNATTVKITCQMNEFESSLSNFNLSQRFKCKKFSLEIDFHSHSYRKDCHDSNFSEEGDILKIKWATAQALNFDAGGEEDLVIAPFTPYDKLTVRKKTGSHATAQGWCKSKDIQAITFSRLNSLYSAGGKQKNRPPTSEIPTLHPEIEQARNTQRFLWLQITIWNQKNFEFGYDLGLASIVSRFTQTN